MNAKRVALAALLSAVTIVVGYARGVGIGLPGIVEFMTVLIFVAGFCFGWTIGGTVGFVTLTIYMLIPYPFAHPAAWLLTISPVLLVVMGGLGAMYGIVGGLLGRVQGQARLGARFIVEMALVGFSLTFVYDIASSIGFYIAYFVYPSVWEAIYMTFIPAYMPYPPIIHTITNTLVFASLAPALIQAMKTLRAYF